MSFLWNSNTSCRKERFKDEVNGRWWRMRLHCEEREALFVTSEVMWSRVELELLRVQLLPLPLTQTHMQTWSILLGMVLRLNRPLWLTLAKINQAAVRTRPGNHEILGVVKGVGSSVVCRAEGTFTGFHWWAREYRVTSAEAKGGRPGFVSERPTNSGAENTVCRPRLLCFLLQTQTTGVTLRLRQIISGVCEKTCFVSIFISTAKKICHKQYNLWEHINKTTRCLPAPQLNAEFNLSTGTGAHLTPGVLLTCVSSCVPPEPWITSPWCKLAPLCSSPAARKQTLEKHREEALLKSLPSDVISDLRPVLFSANHPWRSSIRPFILFDFSLINSKKKSKYASHLLTSVCHLWMQ